MNPWEVDRSLILSTLSPVGAHGLFEYNMNIYYCIGQIATMLRIWESQNWRTVLAKRADNTWYKPWDDINGDDLPKCILDMCDAWLSGPVHAMPLAEFLYRTLGDPNG